MIAAGRRALRDRGYVIVRNQRTEDSATVKGKTPARGVRRFVTPTATIKARSGAGATAVRVWISPLRDERESRAIMEHALALLDGPARSE